MQIVFHRQNHFLLCQHTGLKDGDLVYADNDLKNAVIYANNINAELKYIGPGKWQSFTPATAIILADIALRPGGIVSIHYHFNRKKYILRKSGKYGGRFDLLKSNKEEILSLLPSINWQKQGHEFSIQVNEECVKECSSLLILHAVHCANCLLGIINGSSVPALVDI